ncbi:hypothetical protein G9A89_003175 [Geosiphon pyriformis]|nr:hypothetical protein G9A89_003175 [Geosiphon pyriformis]
MDIGIHDLMTLNNISYVLVSVKNYQKSKDNNFNPSNIRIEQLPTLPFLLLYMQFDANVADVDEKYHFPQVGTSTGTTEAKIERIQRHEKNEFAVRLFGLTAYNFLQENNSRNHLLNTMQPLVYTSEEPAISSQSQLTSQSTTSRVKTSVYCEILETGSSLTPVSFDSIDQKLIPNQQKLKTDITQAIKKAERYFQEKATKTT